MFLRCPRARHVGMLGERVNRQRLRKMKKLNFFVQIFREIMMGRMTLQTMVWLAALGLCLPPLALAESPQTPSVTDVALQEGGVLIGQVVDPQGATLARTSVSLQSGGKEMALSQTDESGYFAFRGLRGGVYRLAAAKGQSTYRVWEPGTAPPIAYPGALIVAGQDTVRGQAGMMGLRNLLANPWVVAGIVATAVAVPVAVHNSDRNPASP